MHLKSFVLLPFLHEPTYEQIKHTAAVILIMLGNFFKRSFNPKPLWYILFTVASLNFPVAAKLLLATSAASPREICF